MYESILNGLPFTSSFRFVDTIHSLDADGAAVSYTLKKDAFFYEDHFKDFPVTPGSIITEIMAQCGLVVPGIYLLQATGRSDPSKKLFPLLTSADVSFYKMVLPGERVMIISKKQYFRFSKLKCYIEMQNAAGELVAKGMFSGMIKELSKPII